MKAVIRVEGVVALLFLWGAISSLVILLLVKAGLNSQLVFALKDMPVFLVAFLMAPFLLTKLGAVVRIAITVVFFVFLVGNFIVVNPGYAAPLHNIRQILSPLVILFVFVHLLRRARLTGAFPRRLFYVHMLIVLFGIFEFFTGFWKYVGLHSYFGLKGIPVDEHGISYMFYEPIINYHLRMTSTLLDPISLGHYFATMVGIAWYGRGFSGRQRMVVLITAAMGLLLCFSKGAMLQAFLLVIVFNRSIPFLLRVALSFLPAVVFFLLPNKDGLLIHFFGLYNAVSSISLWGYGIGAAGNYSKMFSDDLSTYSELGISDTFIGALLGQIGLVGLLLWFVLFISFVYRRDDSLPARFLLSIIVVSVMSENTLNITSFMMPAILIAWIYALSLSPPKSSPESLDVEVSHSFNRQG